MKQLTCKHCSSEVDANDTSCSGCGMPLAKDHGKTSQKRFLIFFIGVVLFSFLMMFLLPLFD